MSDPTRGGYSRKPRRGTADSMQIRRQEAHDELDDSRLNDDQARDRNAARVHDARAIGEYLDPKNSNFTAAMKHQIHEDSAEIIRARVMDRTAKVNADIEKEHVDTGLMSTKLSRSGYDTASKASSDKRKK